MYNVVAIYALSFRMVINHGLSFVLSLPTPRCFFLLEKGSRAVSFHERVAGEREREPSRRRRQLLIPLDISVVSKVTITSATHGGVTSGEPLLDRGQGPRAFPPLVPGRMKHLDLFD